MNKSKNVKKVPSEFWNEEQLLLKCEGHKEFLEGKIDASYATVLQLIKLDVNSKILDIGCGRGEIIKESSKITDWAVGMDYSADAVNIAHHYAESGNVIRGTATNFPFQNNVFDYVTILGFIECLDKEDIAKCLQESKRVLKQDGKIYLATPNAFGVIFFEFFATLHNLIVLRKNPKKNNWHHSRYVCSTFNYFSLRQLLKKNCLKPRIRFDSSTKGRLPSFVYKILFFTAPLHCIAEIEK